MADLVLFGRTQLAIQTPFEPNRNPQYNGNIGPSGINSIDVQSAIEEVKALAFANDRFVLLAHYQGNSNVGRYLEIFTNESSDTSPIWLVNPANLLAVTLQTTAANSTCTVDFFNLTVSSVAPVYSVPMVAQKRVQFSGAPLAVLPANSLLAVRVTSGSINTPTMAITLSAST